MLSVVSACPLLTIEDGRVTTSPGLAPGSTAIYSCNTGFELVGTSVRTCLPDGDWSGTQPACIEGIYASDSNRSSHVYIPVYPY